MVFIVYYPGEGRVVSISSSKENGINFIKNHKERDELWLFGPIQQDIELGCFESREMWKYLVSDSEFE